MAPDPRAQAEQYLAHHNIGGLFEAMTAALLLHKPANPHQFLAAFLTKVEAKGLEAELNRGELEIMFQTFDVTNTGFVSVQQTNQALKTILGPSAELPADVIAGKESFSKRDFVEVLTKLLRSAVNP